MATRAGYFPPGYGIPGMVPSPAPFFSSMMAPGIMSLAASMEAGEEDDDRYAVYDPETGRQIGSAKSREEAEQKATEKVFGVGGDGVVVKGDPYFNNPANKEIPDSEIDEIEKVAPKVAEVLRLKKKAAQAERDDDFELLDQYEKELKKLEEQADEAYQIKKEALQKEDLLNFGELMQGVFDTPGDRAKDITPDTLKLPKKYRGGLIGINEITRGL
jgi:hypothetical protein